MRKVLSSLGLLAKAKAQTMSNEDWEKVDAEFKKMYGKGVMEAMAESRLAEEKKNKRAILALLEDEEEEDPASEDEEDEEEDPSAEGEDDEEEDPTAEDEDNEEEDPTAEGEDDEEEDPTAEDEEDEEPQSMHRKVKVALKKKNKKIATMKKKMTRLASKAAPDRSPLRRAKLSVHGLGTTSSHLFGIESSLFSLKARHNRISANPSLATLSEPSASDRERTFADMRTYAEKLSNVYKQLHSERKLGDLRSAAAAGQFGVGLVNVSGTGLADQYLVLRQEALIAHILMIPDVSRFYPRRYGIQDREVMTNAFFEQVSQPWQPGQVFKGSMELEPEMAYVDDAMAKLYFGQMKEIERQYIGYLNTEGSSPMKWSLIEWMLLSIYEQMIMERNDRNIRGFYIKPNKGVPGHYLNAGTGVIYTLLRYEHENKMLPLGGTACSTYSSATMLEVVRAFVDEFINKFYGRSRDAFVLQLNEDHQHWWMESIRKVYGKDTDFSGPSSYLNMVPDRKVSIEWVPFGVEVKLMVIQVPGNIKLLEFVPGEMLKMNFDTEMEALRGWSNWKEGTSADFVGRKHSNRKALVDNNYRHQVVFTNFFGELVEENATTVDAKKGFRFIFGANTQPTKLTDIKDAEPGVVYVLEQTGETSNATRIDKSGKFSAISSEYTPTQEGDYIMLALNDEGNGFVELERCVGGERKMNATLQPNVPGNGIR